MQTISESAACKEIKRVLKDGGTFNLAINSAIALLVANGRSKYEATDVACIIAERNFANLA